MVEEIGDKGKKTPMVVAACVIRNSGKILLLRRSKPPYVGLFCLPGGKVEFGEHLVAAALRETREETGIQCKFEKMLGVFSEVLETSDGGKKHFIIFVCLLTAHSLEVKTSEEGELQWVDEGKWNELSEQMVPSDWRIVKDFLFEKNSRMELREVKMSCKEQNGEMCYEIEEFTSP